MAAFAQSSWNLFVLMVVLLGLGPLTAGVAWELFNTEVAGNPNGGLYRNLNAANSTVQEIILYHGHYHMMFVSSRSRVVLSGLMAVVLAVVIIGGSFYAGYLPASVRTPETTNQTGGNQGGNGQSPGGGNTGTGGTGNQGTGANGTGSQGGTSPEATLGTLSILVTDPPQVPEGVTAVYMTYSDLAVHATSNDLSHGRIDLNVTGTIEASELINVSQTIASAKVPTGSYDLVRFNISSVAVTYDNLTYPATVSASSFTASFVGGLQVNGTQACAALVDLQPLVINAGTATSPQFVFGLTMDALGISNESVTPDVSSMGFRMDLGNQSWHQSFSANVTRSLEIDSATLTNDSLSLTVTNTGNETQALRFVIVTPSLFATGSHTMQPMYMLPNFFVSMVFAVEPNGSLEPVLPETPQPAAATAISSWLVGGGLNLTAGASVTLGYHGTLFVPSNTTTPGMGTQMGGVTVIPIGGGGGPAPTSYQITVVGSTTSATISVNVQS